MGSFADIKEWPKYILDIYTGFQESQALIVTVDLGLYDLLADHNGGMTASEIARKKNINTDATERLLDYAAALKLIKKNTDVQPAIYSNIPEAAAVLQVSGTNSMVGAIKHASRIQYPLFQHLGTAIKDGSNRRAYKNAFGFDLTSETFESMYNVDEEYSGSFLQFMHQICSTTAPGVVKAFDLSSFRKICDIGGGSGALAYAIASEYPDVSVAVFDLAPAITTAQNIRPDNTKQLKVELIAGDFFKDNFPRADLYVFSRIIHDWEESKVHQLLEKAFNSLESGGAILIAERLLNETKTGPVSAIRANVQMLIEMTGRERTEKEYRQLLDKHGFVDFKCSLSIGAIGIHAMLAKKP